MQSRRLTSATTYGSGQVALDYLVVRAPTDLETFIVTISDAELACSCVANRATTAPCIHVRTVLRGYSANRLAEPLPRAEQPGQARAERHAYLQPTGASRVSTALTQREGEVLRMMVGGLTNPEIGAQLAISADTVTEHVHKIANKLTTRNRTQAVKIAVGIGLVPWRAEGRSGALQRQHGAAAGEEAAVFSSYRITSRPEVQSIDKVTDRRTFIR